MSRWVILMSIGRLQAIGGVYLALLIPGLISCGHLLSPVLRRLFGRIGPHPIHLVALVVRFDLLMLEAVVPLVVSVAEVLGIVVHELARYASRALGEGTCQVLGLGVAAQPSCSVARMRISLTAV